MPNSATFKYRTNPYLESSSAEEMRYNILLICVCCFGIIPSSEPAPIGDPIAPTFVWEPSGRGTVGLLTSCISTIILCVWTTIHINVFPARTRSARRSSSKVMWAIIALFAPEIVLMRALWQLDTARELRDQRNAILDQIEATQGADGTTVGDTSPSESNNRAKDKRWTLEHGFFAVMGGFVARVKDEDTWILDDGQTVTPRGIVELARRDQLPAVDARIIRARSKSDRLSKTVVIFQAAWMFIQTVARKASRLPVTLLEVNTLAHVACALALYIIWWNKPQDAEEPTEIAFDPLLAAFMSSRTFRRCFRPVSQMPEISDVTLNSTITNEEDPERRDQERHQAWQSSSPQNESGYNILGSMAVVFPWHENKLLLPDERDKAEIKCRSVSDGLVMIFPGQRLEGLPFTPILGPQHLRRVDIERLVLWTKLLEHPGYECTDRGGTNFTPDARLTQSAPQNRIQGNLREFSEHRVLLAFALLGLLYGGTHATSWNSHFPTDVEQIMWHVTACVVMGGGMVVYILDHVLRRWTSTFLWPLGKGSHDETRTRSQKWVAICLVMAIKVVVGAISVSRVFLILEAFISCRSVPSAAYSTVDWAVFVPHII
jgi:hypothetical protein